MSELYRSYLNYGKEALKDFDDEAVHQARVSSRKLITLLSIPIPRMPQVSARCSSAPRSVWAR